MSATTAEATIATKSVFENLFEHCHMDNPVFVQGMFWIGVFIVTLIATLYYKSGESKEAQEAELKAQTAKLTKAKDRQVPLI